MNIVDTYNESLNMILNGVTVIAAIAWRDVINIFIDKFVKKQDTVFYKVIYAIIMTFISLIVLNIVKPRLTISKNDVDKLLSKLSEVKSNQEEQKTNVNFI